MKKTLFKVLTVFLIVASISCVFIGCNKDNGVGGGTSSAGGGTSSVGGESPIVGVK